MRTPLADLVAVPDDKLVLRLIRADWYKPEEPPEHRIMTAALPTGQWKSTPESYGPSLFVQDDVEGGVEGVFTAKPEWQHMGAARARVGELRKLGVDVRYSPDDCEINALKPAHATLLNCVNKSMREDILALFGQDIAREPQVPG